MVLITYLLRYIIYLEIKIRGDLMVKKKNLVSDAQIRANDKWKNSNKELQRKYVKKSNAKNYILKTLDTMQELNEVKGWVEEKENILKNK